MQLINILNIPSKYRDRYAKVKNVFISKLEIEMTDEYRVFIATTGTNVKSQYLTLIAFKLGEKIRADSEIKVECGCKSFEFEFANTLARYNSLIENKNIKRQTKVSNKIGIVSGCKHLIFLGRYIFDRKDNFNR